MKKVGVIHTTPSTVESTTRLIEENIKDVHVMNILDDTILPDMANGNNTEYVGIRWEKYAEILIQMGADAVLSACSTVGPFVEAANKKSKIPILRIDDAMAEEAVKRGRRITVLATFKPTLGPTTELIERKDPSAGVKTIFIENAFDLLNAGEIKKHNELISEAVKKEIRTADVIVLAQASMATALSEFNERDKAKILTSPLLGVLKLKKILE